MKEEEEREGEEEDSCCREKMWKSEAGNCFWPQWDMCRRGNEEEEEEKGEAGDEMAEFGVAVLAICDNETEMEVRVVMVGEWVRYSLSRQKKRCPRRETTTFWV
ncbi:hypothetical protein PIB30_099866 [Stylosanthes scabra]|uniref:Uncharacterized protein n=1 Tax=Stylosanthes scabra TaxID=79078 RepID=A0ABU6ZWF9_9FABA|nr:hypothetical protein [Stylosanthes scabra]